MSNHGIATEALIPVEAGNQQRHLQLVEQVASVAVAAEYESDYFNDLSGTDQIPCGD